MAGGVNAFRKVMKEKYRGLSEMMRSDIFGFKEDLAAAVQAVQTEKAKRDKDLRDLEKVMMERREHYAAARKNI